jgi:di/tricarboxylate transporter
MIGWLSKAAKFFITILLMLVVEILVAFKIDYWRIYRQVYKAIVRVLKGIFK